jgi:hypothetical protein
LYTYHDRILVPRPAHDLRILLLTEYHDNDGRPNLRHLLETFFKRLWWERMCFDCKLIALIMLCAIELSQVGKVLHHCLP